MFYSHKYEKRKAERNAYLTDSEVKIYNCQKNYQIINNKLKLSYQLITNYKNKHMSYYTGIIRIYFPKV